MTPNRPAAGATGDHGGGGDEPRRGLRRAYAAAILLLNAAVAFLVLNLVAALLLATWLRPPPPGSLAYGLEKLRPVYPGWTDGDLKQLLTESWTRGYAYSPLRGHREAAFDGRFVNVDPAGFRRVDRQGTWPPDPAAANVFFFGGSTTFGYGLPDGETIPSVLQALLRDRCGDPVSVYNFGAGNYYSDQERALFESLLAAGRVPATAVFLDGLNEWQAEPKFSARLEYLMGESSPRLAARALKTLPLVAAAARLRAKLRPEETPPGADADRATAERSVGRWLGNRRLTEAAAREFAVSTLFVWQPVPTWDYDLDSHPFLDETRRVFEGHGALKLGYRRMEELRRGGSRAVADVLWLADLQHGRHEPLYVDAAHYTAAFSRQIAGRIADFLLQRDGCPAPADPIHYDRPAAAVPPAPESP